MKDDEIFILHMDKLIHVYSALREDSLQHGDVDRAHYYNARAQGIRDVQSVYFEYKMIERANEDLSAELLKQPEFHGIRQ